MIQADVSEKHNLHELGYKIFLDRYAQKDMTRESLTIGDIVIVVMNAQTGQREIGKVTEVIKRYINGKLNDNGESCSHHNHQSYNSEN